VRNPSDLPIDPLDSRADLSAFFSSISRFSIRKFLTSDVGIPARCIGIVLEIIVAGSRLSISQVIKKKVPDGGSSKIFNRALAASEVESREIIACASPRIKTWEEPMEGLLYT
jgi:hypothetical protein